MTDMERDLILKQMENVRKSKIVLPGNAGAGAENRYGQLYQRLVKAGQAQQLRAKYRG